MRSRRAFLGAIAAGGGALAGVDRVVAETETPTGDGDGPAPPENLESGIGLGGGVELTWEGPSDPCASDLSHYAITLNGEQVETVPAGVTRAEHSPDRGPDDGSLVYGVAAVDEAGNTSERVTTEAFLAVADPVRRVGLGLESDEVERGESVRADLVLRPGIGDIPEFDRFEGTVRVSTPCAAEITDVSFPDAVEEGESSLTGSGTDVVELQGSVTAAETDDYPTLATVTFTGRAAGGTALTVSEFALFSEGSEVGGAASTWSTLSVVEPPEGNPQAPSNVRVEQGVSQSVDVFWDGVTDPCASDLSHYVVSVDGTDEQTVPVGVTAASVYVNGEATVGVRAVDENGTESPEVTRQTSAFVADPSLLLAVDTPEEPVAVGRTVEAPIVLSPALGSIPQTLSYEATVTLSTPCAASITGLRSPEDAVGSTETSVADDESSAALSVQGLADDSEPPDVVLGTVELTGRAAGHTEIDVSIESDGDLGAWARWSTLGVEAPDGPPAIRESRPTDPDGDGRYEDLNGNGEVDYADVVTYFENMDEPVMTEYADYYDYNGNGEPDYADLVRLFQSV
ncbi:hypothetical protein [Halomicrobium salinisoli]|uniref:hypothetical protein n=1 Tax=Halomicrobium salinisoli TaxID=2878391 RepID=UPI001CF04232|nr:hypothetical protein [Halomicrobium salinisoli]